MLSREQLKRALDYDALTGIFRWKNPTSRRVDAGDVAGSLMSNGYLNLGIHGRRWLAHHLAWFYVYGEIPNEVDHKNGIRTDNRIDNLRKCVRSENGQNKCKQSNGLTSSYKGVHWAKDREKWVAQICHNKRHRLIGRFSNEDAAAAAYDWSASEIFGSFARLNGEVFVL